MIITGKYLPRRTFLRGMGVTLGLPLLDSMIPALGRAGEAAAKPLSRLSIVYVPNGIIMDKWTPAVEGTAFQLTPILQPLAPFRNQMLVLSGLAHNEGRAEAGEAGGEHSRAGASYLTGVHPNKTEGTDIRNGISLDQIAAKELGKHTQVTSLELGLDPSDFVGACENGYTCAYCNTLSWRGPSTPNPMEVNPRVVFERLFGDSGSTDPAARLARIHSEESILDFARQSVAGLLKTLGTADSSKLNDYLDSVRDLERRIQVAESQASQTLPNVEQPIGIPATFEEHAKLMMDLQVLAFQCDLTRVSTFMMGHELTTRSYAEIGIPDSHHPLTHHGGDADKIAKVFQINTFHTKTFAYFLEKLKSTPDGDGSLLDHSMVLYGSGLSDGNMHQHDNLPTLLVGGAAGQIKGGRHLRFPTGTPMPNLYLTMLDMLKVPVERLGTATGKLELLSV